MPIFRFSPANRLARADSESNLRFERSIFEMQNAALSKIGVAEEALTEQVESLQKAITKQNEELTKQGQEQQQSITDALNSFGKQVQDAVDQLNAVKANLIADVRNAIDLMESASAGGLIGYWGTSDDKNANRKYQYTSGALHATGEIRWMCNGQVNDRSWLYCDGTWRLITDYPQLYSCIGDAFGAVDAGWFQLPTQAQLPGGGTATAGAWWIRT